MPKKPVRRTKKKKLLSISLSDKEWETLQRYVAHHNTTRPAAARRMVKEALHNFNKEFPKGKEVPSNQLGLFDSLQIDIFNQTSKVKG